MTEQDRRGSPSAEGDENFLARWSRRKARARADVSAPASPEKAPVAATADVAPASDTTASLPTPSTASATASAPAIELPNLDDLNQDSDYSAFLTQGVDRELRRRALRKLFASPKFNVFDGLDTYRDDYTQFPALGDVVTADMRHHAERLARKLASELEASADAGPVAAAAPVGPTVASADHMVTAPADAGATEPTEATSAEPVSIDTDSPQSMAPASTEAALTEDKDAHRLPA